MNYIVAVSGGVDSVVLLDMMTQDKDAIVIVAHFEHGIRGKDSQRDAEFVRLLSEQYGVKCSIEHGNLGADASEDTARRARYEFLRRIAKENKAQIVTAHHADDVAESIAINLMRGTGWRGIAVMSATDIKRPLLTKRKRDLYDYALQHNLEWVEDETNRDNHYLRNQMRTKLAKLDDTSIVKLLSLRSAALQLRQLIESETQPFAQQSSRYFFIMIPYTIALELLRYQTNERLLTVQLERLLLSIKTARPGTLHQLGNGVSARMLTDKFIVEVAPRVV